jgi:hypothetical protein
MKKTGLMKVTKRKPFRAIYRINRLPHAPYKEMVTILDYTSSNNENY